MTISILAFDEKTGVYGGGAATGSLCVGGWVLRGDAESGLSASQGSLPSTMWGNDVLARMRDGEPADLAVRRVVDADAGRDEQLRLWNAIKETEAAATKSRLIEERGEGIG